jgi:hypothetical protein
MKLIVFEGLGFGLPYLQASYIEMQLLPALKGVTTQVYSWMQNPDLTPTPGQKQVIVGHSFGAAKICGANYSADLIVTIDPRWTGFDSFTAGSNAKKWVNYYERNLLFNLPGCPVNGADNTLLTDYHTQICGDPVIAKFLNAWIGANL